MSDYDWIHDVIESDLPDSQRKFSDVIGVEATLKLCEAFAGEQVYVPKNDAVKRIVRDREIKRLYASGWRVRQLARHFGLAEPYVHTLIADARVNQITMFDD